jgi:hypothetical protein
MKPVLPDTFIVREQPGTREKSFTQMQLDAELGVASQVSRPVEN